MTPVMCGSAYKNKGVQVLLDMVCQILPAPTEVENIALDQRKGARPERPQQPLGHARILCPHDWIR